MPLHSLGQNLHAANQAQAAQELTICDRVGAKIQSLLNTLKKYAAIGLQKTKGVVEKKSFQVSAGSGVVGTVMGGAGGGFMGLFVGGAIGTALGLVPALFTFGLSVPLGALWGSGCGIVAGTALGSTVGLFGATTVGYGAYTHREKISASVGNVADACSGFACDLKSKVKSNSQIISAAVKEKSSQAIEVCSTKLHTGIEGAKVLAADQGFQVTAATAAGGAVVVGAGGAATGLAFGGTLGAAVGVVPALVTFGASIPFCAVVGGVCGSTMGAVCGSAAGLIGGGAVGYGTYSRRESIGNGVTTCKAKIGDCAEYVKVRLVGGTGGTCD